MTSDSKLDYPKASEKLERGSIYLFVAGLTLLVAFLSPYWISSYDESFNDFENMGVWMYCFNGFRYPYYQFDKRFTGCYWIYSSEYYVIREWLLPGWLLFIQLCVTLSFLFSFSAQFILSAIIIRYPLQMVLTYEYLLTMVAFILTASSAVLLMFSVLLFPLNCWRRDWLLTPLYNHLSWSYYFALISFVIHAGAAYVLYKESKRAWEYRKESRNLVMQMYPRNDRHAFTY